MTRISNDDIVSFGKVLRFIGERMDGNCDEVLNTMNEFLSFAMEIESVEDKSNKLSSEDFRNYLSSFTVNELKDIIKKYSIAAPKKKKKSDIVDSIMEFFEKY